VPPKCPQEICSEAGTNYFRKMLLNAVGLPPTALSTAQFRRPENKLGDSFRVADQPGAILACPESRYRVGPPPRKDFIVPGNWHFDVYDLDNIRRSVSGIEGGFHGRCPAVLACSFHRWTFTPLTMSHNSRGISPRAAAEAM
jgi:hypothetical protein